MDCRSVPALLVSLLLFVSGCTWPIAGLRTNSGPAANNPGDDTAHRPETYVAFGDFRAAAGFTSEVNPQQQQQLRSDARRAYQKAIELDPKHLPAHLALARLELRCENCPAARVSYRKAVELSPRESALWCEMGMCECRQKNWVEGINCLQKALQLDPANKQAGVTLGYTLARAGRWEDSLGVLRNFRGEAQARYDLARMLRHMNQPEKARQQLELALRQEPQLAGAKLLMAELQGEPNKIQTASYTGPAEQDGPKLAPAEGETTPPTPLIIQGAKELPPEADEPTPQAGKSLRMPPLPVISIHSK